MGDGSLSLGQYVRDDAIAENESFGDSGEGTGGSGGAPSKNVGGEERPSCPPIIREYNSETFRAPRAERLPLRIPFQAGLAYTITETVPGFFTETAAVEVGHHTNLTLGVSQS